jgi:hypothetical protein
MAGREAITLPGVDFAVSGSRGLVDRIADRRVPVAILCADVAREEGPCRNTDAELDHGQPSQGGGECAGGGQHPHQANHYGQS